MEKISSPYMSTTKVLYIDDEGENLRAFEASFRKDYKVMTANSAKEGLAMMEQYPEIEVVIADQRMPEMTGVQFFEQLRETHPDAIRILLTGYSDLSSVVSAINRGGIYQYIEKPWQEEEIRMAIRNSRDIYETRINLKEKNRKLEKALDEIDQFVYSISHDLRSPLTSIMGVVDLAKAETKEPHTTEYLDMIDQLSDKLNHFIQQVTDYFQGSRDLSENQEVALENIVKDVLMNFQYDPATKDVDFDVSISEGQRFFSNPLKIKIIINNLVSNSVKYRSSRRPPIVHIRAEIDPDQLLLTVEDNGQGIEEEKLEKVFDMFYRASTRSEGSGLGLYIVQEAVQSLGGEINYSSAPGRGTRMTIALPNEDSLKQDNEEE